MIIVMISLTIANKQCINVIVIIITVNDIVLRDESSITTAPNPPQGQEPTWAPSGVTKVAVMSMTRRAYRDRNGKKKISPSSEQQILHRPGEPPEKGRGNNTHDSPKLPDVQTCCRVWPLPQSAVALMFLPEPDGSSRLRGPNHPCIGQDAHWKYSHRSKCRWVL